MKSRYFKLLGAVIFGLLVISTSFAANTVKLTGNTINISSIDSDWNVTSLLSWVATGGLSIDSIVFIPGAISDKCIIKEKTAAGSILFYVPAVDKVEGKIQYYNSSHTPYLDFSDGTYSSGSIVIITIAPY